MTQNKDITISVPHLRKLLSIISTIANQPIKAKLKKPARISIKKNKLGITTDILIETDPR